MTTTLSGALREATRDAHEAAERTPLSAALAEGTLPKQSAVSYLRGLAIVHAVLERSLELAAIPGLWDPALARLPALLDDLAGCGATGLPDIDPAIDAAIALGDAILLDTDHPARLAGRLYVLEGSLLGGQILKGWFAAALGAPDTTLAYFTPGPEGAGRRWQQVKQRLDALPLEYLPEAIAAAKATFAGIEQMAIGCFPYTDASLRQRVTALNPEAGRHAMPQDAREVDMALRAADVAWRQHPYLEARYGARGRRFTLSDSCWLASLRSLAPDDILTNLRWLAGVLAVRGLPTTILERHLQALDDQFGLPVFAAAIAALRARRALVLPEADAVRLTAHWQERLPDYDAADLLVTALADEAAGADGTWDSVHTWFTDPVRFSGEWVAAVDGLMRETRAVLR